MDIKNLKSIRLAVLRDLKDFIPINSYKPIYFPGYINPVDWDVANHIKLRQAAANPRPPSNRQEDALSLFEKIIAFADAEKNELKYTGADHEEKEFNEKRINDALRFLKESLKLYVKYLISDEEKELLKHCEELLTAEPIDITKKTSEVNSKEDELQDVHEEPKAEEPPGKEPKNAVGKLAVKAAWEFECLHNKKASAKDVMSMLQDWADNNEHPETLLKSNKSNKSVTWITGKMISKEYSLEACGKILMEWHKSRD